MYQTGELILYGSNGVCRVAAVGAPNVPYVEKGRSYYTLAPLYSTETIFVPVDTGAYMRPVLSGDEAAELITEMPTIPKGPVEEKNPKAFAQYCQGVIASHDSRALISLLKTIYERDAAAHRKGKQPGKIEERYRKQGEELLHGELAVALDIRLDEVIEYIKGVLEKDNLETA